LPPNAKLTEGETSSKLAAKLENTGQANLAPEKEVRQTLSSGPETQPLPPSQPNEVHVQVDAPFVFHARPRPAAPPAPTNEAAALPVMEMSAARSQLEIQIQPPPAEPQGSAPPGSAPRRFLRRIKGIFVAIFR
jgi:hypothetical protein